MAKEEKNSGAILYFEYAEHFDLLSREDRGDLVTAMLEYGMSGVVTTELSTCARMAFSFIKKQMDRDAEKYKEKCKKNSENGSRGGRPKKDDPAEKANGFSEDEKKPNGFSENPTKPNGDFKKTKKANEKENKKEKENTLSGERVDARARESTPSPDKKGYGKHQNLFLTAAEYAEVQKHVDPDYVDKVSEKFKKKNYQFDDHYEIIVQWAIEHNAYHQDVARSGFDTDKAFESALRRAALRKARSTS